MSSNQEPTQELGQTAPAAEIKRARFGEEMEQSYIDYAMSVIAGRALPDVRDGLKPVHRRILYAMEQQGVTSGSSHRKSSSIVGETMGDFHPHGDSAIYDALARMAQDFSMRHELVDGQGNFGSVDGDPPAAMRYTEARMSPMAEGLLEDLDKETVPFEPNYDNRKEEPEVLPAAFPNLLVNGSSGIAVGMSTKIPPHNLGEIVDATTHLIDNPDCTVEDLMEHVPGPDFPTGGNIVGREGIYEAYTTGRGRVRMQAEYEVDKEGTGNDRIIITGLPYQTNKARLVEKIADDVNNEDSDLSGISDIKDESNRKGVRIVIDVKRNAMTDVVENKLLSSHLKKTFGVINLALVDGEPEILTLKETLHEYINHRKEVVRNRVEHDLEETEDRIHILEGRLTALDNADDIVEMIQNAEDRDEAKEDLKAEYGFSDEQVNHIVSMQLGSLTSMEGAEIQSEHEELQEDAERYTEILNNESELQSVIKDELNEVKDEHADERRTNITEDTGNVTNEDLIPEEDIVVVRTEDDYLKRMPTDRFDTQGRGGKGVIGIDLKDGDAVADVFSMSTHDHLLLFTEGDGTTGASVYQLKGYDIPEQSRTARGKPVVSLDTISVDSDETIAAATTSSELEAGNYLAFISNQGSIKRTDVEEFNNILTTGIQAMDLNEGETLVDVTVTNGDSDFLIESTDGNAIRFNESVVRSMGRSARGVRAMNLDSGSSVAGFTTVTDEDSLLTLSENGYGKRTELDTDVYGRQGRNGTGLLDIKTTERNGDAVSVDAVDISDEIVLMSQDGQIIRIDTEEVSELGRNTQGVIIMETSNTDSIAGVSVIDTSE